MRAPLLPIGRLDIADYQDEVIAMHDVCYGHELEPPGQEGWWWAAWDGDAPVAFAQMVVDPLDPKGTVYFSRDGTLPHYRGRGLQKRLIQIRIAAARRMGFTTAVSDTHFDNCASLNAYMHNGFKTFLPENPWMGDGEVYLIRDLC